MPYGEPGTLIHGTLRPQDLVPVFLDELRRLDRARFDEYVQANPGMLPGEIPASAIESNSDPWWDTESVTWALDSLFDTLGEYSPEGYYFGTHEGDGADFGWWPVDRDEDYEGYCDSLASRREDHQLDENPSLPSAPARRPRPGRAETTLDTLRRMTRMEEARHQQAERPFDPEAGYERAARGHHFAVNADVRGPIRLRNGRVVVHTRAPNGSTDAHMQDGGPMSEAEWQEYTAKLKAASVASSFGPPLQPKSEFCARCGDRLPPGEHGLCERHLRVAEGAEDARGGAHRPNARDQGVADRHAADDLVLFIENTADLSIDGPRGHGHSILLNALRKWRKGTYDPEQAVQLFAYLAESGAKQYVRENHSSLPWNRMFSVPTRLAAAREMAESFARRAQAGEFDHVDTKIGAR